MASVIWFQVKPLLFLKKFLVEVVPSRNKKFYKDSLHCFPEILLGWVAIMVSLNHVTIMFNNLFKEKGHDC